MALTEVQQYEFATKLIDAACKATGYTYLDLIEKNKVTELTDIRGVCCLISWEEGIHARRFAKLMHRTRSNVINMAKKYRQFKRMNDSQTIYLYNLIKTNLNGAV